MVNLYNYKLIHIDLWESFHLSFQTLSFQNNILTTEIQEANRCYVMALVLRSLQWKRYRHRPLLRWLSGKEFACSAGDVGSTPGLGRSPGEGNSNPLQYSCLENSMVRGAWWATVFGVAKSRTGLNTYTSTWTSNTGRQRASVCVVGEVGGDQW